MRSKKMHFLTPEEWLPSSPDVAPMDYFFWSYLKKRVNMHKITKISSLKKAIRQEVKNIPQNIIDSALQAWPRRCRRIYYNKGLHIQQNN